MGRTIKFHRHGHVFGMAMSILSPLNKCGGKTAPLLPSDYIWRRLHSLMGFGLVIFLCFHLFVNSLAVLLPDEDSRGFINAVNNIENTALLPVVEILFLAVPFLIHIIWGVKYLLTSKFNYFSTDGSAPSLKYCRNRAYTWQRITSWLLIFGILAHVIHMRFVERPTIVRYQAIHNFMVPVSSDPHLYTLVDRLGAVLYTKKELAERGSHLKKIPSINADSSPEKLREALAIEDEHNWVKASLDYPLDKNELLAVADNFGTAELLMVRDTFKSPWIAALYTLLVLTAVYHAFNGLWTFMICWGVTLTERSQALMRKFCFFCAIVVALLGLAAIWGIYWLRVWLI